MSTRTARVAGVLGVSAAFGMAGLTASPAHAADQPVGTLSDASVGTLSDASVGTLSDASAKAAAFPCTILKIGGSAGNVRLWWCDGTQGTRRGYHAQGYLAGGGAVWLVSAAGDPVAFTTSGVSGWFNSKTVGDYGAPWKACKHNGPITSPHECTGYGSR
ncbi:hypothetical protein E1218_35695 [Kribbella turkmenica]|uniref:SH3 domain-containing protein n=1 Tax=Kribbella turkmenica TaxID=2530375 RepID=A0A4V2YCI4_9ACTN|nr:hypothetical protein [Kribbella turkmenica]TDD11656.1 hypothetical protein E1218_35695 [Kribbella turkmenica]